MINIATSTAAHPTTTEDVDIAMDSAAAELHYWQEFAAAEGLGDLTMLDNAEQLFVDTYEAVDTAENAFSINWRPLAGVYTAAAQAFAQVEAMAYRALVPEALAA